MACVMFGLPRIIGYLRGSYTIHSIRITNKLYEFHLSERNLYFPLVIVPVVIREEVLYSLIYKGSKVIAKLLNIPSCAKENRELEGPIFILIITYI